MFRQKSWGLHVLTEVLFMPYYRDLNPFMGLSHRLGSVTWKLWADCCIFMGTRFWDDSHHQIHSFKLGMTCQSLMGSASCYLLVDPILWTKMMHSSGADPPLLSSPPMKMNITHTEWELTRTEILSIGITHFLMWAKTNVSPLKQGKKAVSSESKDESNAMIINQISNNFKKGKNFIHLEQGI